MSLQIPIKAGAITNLTDARYFAAIGVEWIGFCFDPESKHFIHPDKAKEIIDWISGPKIVGEFGRQSIEHINHLSELLSLDAVQLNYLFSLSELESVKRPVIPCILLDNNYTLSIILEKIQQWGKSEMYILSCKEYKEDILKEICGKYPIILEVDVENIQMITERIKPFAIQVSGGSEEKTGVGNFEKLDEMIDFISK